MVAQRSIVPSARRAKGLERASTFHEVFIEKNSQFHIHTSDPPSMDSPADLPGTIQWYSFNFRISSVFQRFPVSLIRLSQATLSIHALESSSKFLPNSKSGFFFFLLISYDFLSLLFSSFCVKRCKFSIGFIGGSCIVKYAAVAQFTAVHDIRAIAYDLRTLCSLKRTATL